MLKSQHHLQIKNNRGDTLIEVLLAITVLSLVIVMAMSLMNQGTTASIRSLQITVVRQEIDNQAEALRYLNTAFVAAYSPEQPLVPGSAAAEYAGILSRIKDNQKVNEFNGNQPTCTEAPEGSFFMNVRNAKKVDRSNSSMAVAETYSQLVYPDHTPVGVKSEGLWIEAVRSVEKTAGVDNSYTDFHIRACWYAPGVAMPMNIGTIVRLYDPAN